MRTLSNHSSKITQSYDHRTITLIYFYGNQQTQQGAIKPSQLTFVRLSDKCLSIESWRTLRCSFGARICGDSSISDWDRLGRKMGFEEHNRLLNNCVCLCVVIKCEGPIEWYQQNLVRKGTSCRIWFGKKKKINVTTTVRSWTTRRAKNNNNNETFSLRINTNNVQLHPIQGHLSLSQFHMSNSTSRYYWLILPCRAWNYTLHKHTQTDERTNRSALIEA